MNCWCNILPVQFLTADREKQQNTHTFNLNLCVFVVKWESIFVIFIIGSHCRDWIYINTIHSSIIQLDNGAKPLQLYSSAVSLFRINRKTHILSIHPRCVLCGTFSTCVFYFILYKLEHIFFPLKIKTYSNWMWTSNKPQRMLCKCECIHKKCKQYQPIVASLFFCSDAHSTVLKYCAHSLIICQ